MTRSAPFRADVVGSLLRPSAVKRARIAHAAGSISDADLRRIEDDAVGAAVRRQKETGLRVASDGELRRA